MQAINQISISKSAQLYYWSCYACKDDNINMKLTVLAYGRREYVLRGETTRRNRVEKSVSWQASYISADDLKATIGKCNVILIRLRRARYIKMAIMALYIGRNSMWNQHQKAIIYYLNVPTNIFCRRSPNRTRKRKWSVNQVVTITLGKSLSASVYVVAKVRIDRTR